MGNKNFKQNLAIIFIMIIAIWLFQFTITDNVDIDRNNNTENSTGMSKLTTKEDRKFQEWTNSLSIQGDLRCITQAANRKNLTDTQICGRILKENSNRSLRQISEFNVSPAFEMTISEYKKSLELYYIAGINLENGAKNNDIDLVASATDYLEKGKKKMSNAHYLLSLVS